MDKDLLKGLLMVLAIVAIFVAIAVVGFFSDPNQAACISDALKAHVPVANIDKLCHLTQH